MRLIYLANVILLVQGLFSKILRRKSWVNQIDKNLHEYELIREGW